MKKKLVSFMLAGCTFNTNLSFTFDVDTGNSIKVSLDTTDGFVLSSDVPFEVSQDGNDGHCSWQSCIRRVGEGVF